MKLAIFSWGSEVSRTQWQVLFAGFLGWLLDAMDAMLFSFALVAIRDEFHLSNSQVGMLASITLLTSVGGILFGMLADRIGRVRALSYSIFTYSLFTALLATSHTLWELILWRALVGFGLGGEWATGAVLVAESWPASLRGRAIGLMQSGWAIGYLIAAALAAGLMPRFGWRPLFVLGILPALFTFWIRRHLSHAEAPRVAPAEKRSGVQILTRLFAPPNIKTTLIATLLSTVVLFAYWGLFTWVPAFLSAPIEKGGAGLNLAKSSAWVIPMQVGSFFGYISFGYFSDKYGRRPSFVIFVLAAALSVFIYGNLGSHPVMLMLLGPLLGFFGHGYFSVFGSLLAELFPGDIRATAQAFCYNGGRAISALAPVIIGSLADSWGTGAALTTTALFFSVGAVVIYFLPETRGKELSER